MNMSTYEDEIRQALKADFDSGGLIEVGDAKDVFLLLEAAASYSVIARSTCDEAIQTASAEGFWIASLRSQ